MGIGDFFRKLFGGSSVKSAATSAAVSSAPGVPTPSEPEEEEEDYAQREWREVQQYIAQFEANPDDMCGLSWQDGVGYWQVANEIDQSEAQNIPRLQAAQQRGFRDLDHWERVQHYIMCKWQRLQKNEDGELEVQLDIEFQNAMLQGAQSQIAGMQAAALAADPTLLEPVNGVTVEQWAGASAALAALGTTGTPQQVAEAQARFGLDAASYDAANAGWGAKMQRDTTGVIAAKFGEAFTASQGLPTGGAGAEPCSFEKYIEIMTAQEAWAQQGLDIGTMLQQTFGIQIVDYSNYSTYWSPKMSTDMNYINQMEPLRQKYLAKYSGGSMDDDLSL